MLDYQRVQYYMTQENLGPVFDSWVDHQFTSLHLSLEIQTVHDHLQQVSGGLL